MRSPVQIYIASTTTHAAQWREIRDAAQADGRYVIVSTWIDEVDIGASSAMANLAQCCVTEAATADCLILYAEVYEVLRGALVEVGAALAHGHMVYVVGDCISLQFAFRYHPLWVPCNSIDEALLRACGLTQRGLR
jgi:hypothetical protein